MRVARADHVTNYEARMAAEVQLYWIIYQKSCGSQVDLIDTKLALQGWKQDWAGLFSESHERLLVADAIVEY